jgi:hypothetical protein
MWPQRSLSQNFRTERLRHGAKIFLKTRIVYAMRHNISFSFSTIMSDDEIFVLPVKPRYEETGLEYLDCMSSLSEVISLYQCNFTATVYNVIVISKTRGREVAIQICVCFHTLKMVAKVDEAISRTLQRDYLKSSFELLFKTLVFAGCFLFIRSIVIILNYIL